MDPTPDRPNDGPIAFKSPWDGLPLCEQVMAYSQNRPDGQKWLVLRLIQNPDVGRGDLYRDGVVVGLQPDSEAVGLDSAGYFSLAVVLEAEQSAIQIMLSIDGIPSLIAALRDVQKKGRAQQRRLSEGGS